jgi:4-diphosphocytidyl-2-C-methyl-D-erythritol kinase
LSDWISEKACAKINLALHVLGRRPDGYHELDSIVAFADLGDELNIRLADKLELICSGLFAADVPSGGDNIVLRAWTVLNSLKQIPPVQISLEKNLPVASGIGGGSADAAALLRGMLRLTQQTLNEKEIASMAKSLGADVPVCFHQKPARMRGIGETINTLTIELPRAIVLVNPLQPCTTADVFKNLALNNGQTYKDAIDLHNPHTWRNDLSDAALKVQPIIADVLQALSAEPSFSAVRMSGSGATCFGLCKSMSEANAAWARLSVKNPNWWVRTAELD